MKRGSGRTETKTARDGAADATFAALLQAFAREPEVTQGRMFGAPGLKVGGKVFAMLVKESLVVKLPADRVEALVASGAGARFDPGHGRLMREWVAVGPRARTAWIRLAREARAFVAPGR